MEVVIILLSACTIILFTMQCINNETLKEIKEKLTEKEPEIKVMLESDGNRYSEELKPSEDLMPSEELKRNINIAKKFEVGTKVVAMKGIHIGEVYTIEKINLLWYEAVLQPYKLPEGVDYMETLRINLDDLENEFEPLEDEK